MSWWPFSLSDKLCQAFRPHQPAVLTGSSSVRAPSDRSLGKGFNPSILSPQPSPPCAVREGTTLLPGPSACTYVNPQLRLREGAAARRQTARRTARCSLECVGQIHPNHSIFISWRPGVDNLGPHHSAPVKRYIYTDWVSAAAVTDINTFVYVAPPPMLPSRSILRQIRTRELSCMATTIQVTNTDHRAVYSLRTKNGRIPRRPRSAVRSLHND